MIWTSVLLLAAIPNADEIAALHASPQGYCATMNDGSSFCSDPRNAIRQLSCQPDDAGQATCSYVLLGTDEVGQTNYAPTNREDVFARGADLKWRLMREAKPPIQLMSFTESR